LTNGSTTLISNPSEEKKGKKFRHKRRHNHEEVPEFVKPMREWRKARRANEMVESIKDNIPMIA